MAARRGAARRWTAQAQVPVEIDWGSPLSRDLLYAGGFSTEADRGLTDGSSFFDRSDALLHNIAGPRGSLHGYYLDNVPPRIVEPYGVASYFNGNADGYTTGKAYTLDLTGVANGAASDESCLVICTPEQSTGSQNIMGFSTVWSTSLSDYGRGIGIESGQFMAWGASAVNLKRRYGTLTTLGEPVVLAARFAVDGFLMVNGVVVSSGDMSHSWGYKFAVGNAIATVESNASAPFKGSIGPRLWWRRGLSIDELTQLSDNAFAILRPMRRRTSAASSSGATINATASITDADDTISAAATADVAVSANFTDAADATNSAGAISIDAAVSVTDATDATSATSTVSIAAALSVTDDADSITSAGTVGFTGITADAAITDTADSITAAGTVSIAASASIADATDATNAAAAVALSSSFSVTDSTDSISAAGTVGGSLSGLTAAEIAAAVWAEPLSGATTASQILSGMADLLRDRGYLP